MSITLKVDHDRSWAYVKAEGSITLAEIKQHLEEERRARGLTYPELVDARAAKVPLSCEEIYQLIDVLKNLAKQERLGPTAIVVSSDVNYGILRMVETLLAEVTQIRPFRDFHEAEVWLAQQQA